MTIGDAALGLALRLATPGRRSVDRAVRHLLDRYLHPQPRLALSAAIP
jgi:thiamine-monophosphate kinase